MTGDWTDQDAADDIQGINKTTQISKPIEHTVGLPIHYQLVKAEIDLDAAELISCEWVLWCRILVP